MRSKLDHRLITEIRERGQMDQYPVTIELVQAVTPVKEKARGKTLEKLKDQVQANQADVINLLTSMGVKDFQVLSLSNSIKTSLTLDQIDKVAKQPDVKIVRLIKPEKVTT